MGRGSKGWEPPHCPNPKCRFHNGVGERWKYLRRGSYRRQAPPHCIPRFTCCACNRHFSVQSFQISYWQKRPDLIVPIAAMTVGCMANRQIARALRCAPSTVAHHIARLGRHALLFQSEELQRISLDGDVVIDGFESFEWSQYFPYHHNVAVEADTGYFLFHTDSPLRRKGRMRPDQKRRRAELETRLGRPDPRAVEKSIRELLEAISPGEKHLQIRSDDHRAYPRAIAALPIPCQHQVTSSRAHRGNRNPLWEVNLLDLMIRHSTAAHKRETIAWAKRRQAAVEKLTIFQVWRNYVKRRWEKGDGRTSAMLKGLVERPLTLSEIFRRRRFRTRVSLPATWSRYYDREIQTVALPVNRTHRLTYAY